MVVVVEGLVEMEGSLETGSLGEEVVGGRVVGVGVQAQEVGGGVHRKQHCTLQLTAGCRRVPPHGTQCLTESDPAPPEDTPTLCGVGELSSLTVL